MPVGNSDKGVGLWAGQISIGSDFLYQNIDWSHGAIPGELDPNGNLVGDHSGILSTYLYVPNVTIGLSNYLNLTFSQIIGNRYMDWGNSRKSIHHRSEGSHTDYENAIGGYLGDSRLILRYLAINTARGTGKRIFFGGGLVIPSNNTLTSDPFSLLDPNSLEDHRHFSMSEGVYKAILETQFFIKRKYNPVFMGTFLVVELPLHENKYGFKAPRIIEVSFSSLTSKLRYVKSSLSFGLSIQNSSLAYWNGIEAPNTQSTILIPTIGMLWSTKIATLALNLQKPMFINGSIPALGSEVSDHSADTWQLSFSIRKVLDYTIPWLYW